LGEDHVGLPFLKLARRDKDWKKACGLITHSSQKAGKYLFFFSSFFSPLFCKGIADWEYLIQGANLRATFSVAAVDVAVAVAVG